jgi:hypothetical protein
MQSRNVLIALIAALTLATVHVLAPGATDLVPNYVTTLEVIQPNPHEPSKQDRPQSMKVLPEVVVTAHITAAPATSPLAATAALPERLGNTLPRVRLSMPYYAFRRATAE